MLEAYWDQLPTRLSLSCAVLLQDTNSGFVRALFLHRMAT